MACQCADLPDGGHAHGTGPVHRIRPLIGLVAVAMLLSRAVVVFGLVPQLARLPDSEPVSRGYQLVMYWGGLRGAIAIAIVLSLPDFPAREALVTIVMGAVLFTLLVQGLTVEPLVRRLGLPAGVRGAGGGARGGAARQAGQPGRCGRLERDEIFSPRVAAQLREDAERTSPGWRRKFPISPRVCRKRRRVPSSPCGPCPGEDPLRRTVPSRSDRRLDLA